MTRRLDAAEYERARTFLLDIAKDLLPADTPWRSEAHECRADHSGGLSINTKRAAWHFFGSGAGGYSPLGLIEQLRPHYSTTERLQHLEAWLAQHLGTGACTTESDDDDETGAPSPAGVARAQEVLGAMQPAEGTPAETYLRGRGLAPPYPESIGYLEDARRGEGALVAVLTAHERVTGVQVGYLAPSGKKSQVGPQRERFNLEKAPGAVFRLPPSPEALAGPRDPVADYITVEGIEDALTLRQLDRPCVVLGLPGIAALAHLDLPQKSRVVHFEDGDEKDSAADRGCVRGIDHLLNAGMFVWTVPTPLGLDANAILTERNLGIEVLRTMLRRARPDENIWPPGLFTPSLSFEARVAKLAKLDGTTFAQERAAILKIFRSGGIQAKDLDAELKKHRPPKPPGGDGPSAGGEPDSEPDEPWEGPLPPLGTMLDTAVAAMRRFLVAEDFVYDVLTLWSAVTHLVHSAEVALPVMPQLAFQSRSENAGKSVGLEITSTLSYRGQPRSSYTAASVFRRIAATGDTFCLSELHNILTPQNTELRAIVNACHRRAEAFVDRVEGPDAKGRRYPVTFPCWAALAWASIGPMVREVQSRAIVLPMKPALPDEYHALDDSSPSRYPALIDARRQLAAWAATIKRPLVRLLPKEVFNRLGDNWKPLFAVARMAGGDWPARVKIAMEEVGKVEKTLPREVRLLIDIRGALEASPEQRLGTAELIDKLCENDEAGWTEANHGKRITAYWLRYELRGMLNPRGSQEWQEGKAPNRTHVRGYELHQFRDAIIRYLSPNPQSVSGTTGATATDGAKAAETAEFSDPRSPGASGTDPGREKASESSGLQEAAPGAPVVPDAPGVGGEEETAPIAVVIHVEDDTWDWMRGRPKGAASADTPPADPAPVEHPSPLSAEKLAEKLSSAPKAPNGPAAAPTVERGIRSSREPGILSSREPGIRASNQKVTIRDAVLAHARAHPEWSAKDIAKVVPRTASVIQRILDAALRDSAPEEIA